MFGTRIDPNEEKFQDALAKKEQEEKKAEKALRKQQKQQKMLDEMRKLAEASRLEGKSCFGRDGLRFSRNYRSNCGSEMT